MMTLKSELEKVSISSTWAKKLFSKRYTLGEMAENYAANHSDPSKLVNYKTDLSSAKKKVQHAKKYAEKLKEKTTNASAALDKRRVWEKNKAKYGKRNPTLMDKAKKKFTSISDEMFSAQGARV